MNTVYLTKGFVEYLGWSIQWDFRRVKIIFDVPSSGPNLFSYVKLYDLLCGNTGLGVQIACEIVKIIRPSCVIQLKINNNYKRNFPFFLNKENVANHRSSLTSRVPEKYRQPLEDYHFLTVNSAMNCESTTNTNVWLEITLYCQINHQSKLMPA